MRDWIHVDDHCSGVMLAMERGQAGSIYNLGDVDKITNIAVVQELLSILNESSDLIEFVGDRLGHDFRYAINSNLARNELGWRPTKTLSSSLSSVVDWYRHQ